MTYKYTIDDVLKELGYEVQLDEIPESKKYSLTTTATMTMDLMNRAYLQGCVDTHQQDLEKMKEKVSLMMGKE